MPLAPLGNLQIQNGQASVGLSSGLPTKDIIDGLLTSEQQKLTDIQDDITLSNNKIAAYEELSTMLADVSGITNLLRKPPNADGIYLNNDGTITNQNLFDARQILVTSSNSNVNYTDYIDFNAIPGTEINEYIVNNITIAKSKIEMSNSFASNSTSVVNSSPAAMEFAAGSFIINNNGNPATITLTEGDKLTDVVSAINYATKTTNVSAYIIKVSASDYRLVMQSTIPGTSYAYTIDDIADNVWGNVTMNNQQTAIDTSATINGIPISRDSNVITDFVEGLTITLKQDNNTDSFTGRIQNYTVPVIEGIKLLVNEINDVLRFNARQHKRDGDYLLVEDAVLGRESEFENIMVGFEQAYSWFASGNVSDSSFRSLFDIGIDLVYTETEDEDGTPAGTSILYLEETTLQQSIDNDFDKVREIFEFQNVISSNVLKIIERSNNVTVNSFTLDIDTGRSSEDIVRITAPLPQGGNETYNADYISAGGTTRIHGQIGTSISGLKMFYTGDGTDVITVEFTQGVADRLYNQVRSVVNDSSYLDVNGNQIDNPSALSIVKDSINEYVITLEDNEERQESRIERKRERLERQYVEMEAAYQKAAMLVSTIEAQQALYEKSN